MAAGYTGRETAYSIPCSANLLPLSPEVSGILEKYGRREDYVEISLASPYRYDPLHNELEAYALAYGIASLLNNLFGRGTELFWQQA